MQIIIRIIGVVGAMLMLGGVAFGQIGSGGLRANDTSTAEPARMHDPGVTPNIMVDGQNPEGAPARQSFMAWKDAVALGRRRAAADTSPIPLGDVARMYRTPKPYWNGAVWSCPVGLSVYVSEREAMAGLDGVHCVAGRP